MRKFYLRPIFIGLLICFIGIQDLRAQDDDGCLCEFGIQYMTIRYDGPSGETIEVFATKDQRDFVTEFEGVASGDQLFVDKSDFLHGSVKTKTYFRVKGMPDSEVTFHTSCSEDIINQTKGYFTVTSYQDAFGHSCSVSLELSADVTHNMCFGDSSGTIDLMVSGGFPPYIYEWGDGTTVANRSGLINGSYAVSIEDALGNTLDSTFLVNSPQELTLSAEQEVLGCGQDAGGQITLNVTGGVPPYTYSWSTGDTTKMVAGLDSGSYIAQVVDSNGCSISATYETGPVDDLAVSVQEDACSNGLLQAMVSGGKTPYTYEWSNGSTSNETSVTEAGTYHVYVTDANGCESTDSIVINEIAFLEATASYTSPTCYDGADGAIEISAEGSHGPFDYQWSTGDTTQNIDNIPAGTYDLILTDSRGEECSKSFSFDLTAPMKPEIYATINQISCAGDTDGAITIDSLSGIGPFDILWTSGDTTSTLTDLESGEYTLTITDSSGCAVTKSFSIDEPDTLRLSLDYDFCLDSDIKAAVNGGTSPYNFTWNGFVGSDVYAPESAGVYTVAVTDANGCEATSSIEVPEVFQPLNISGTVTQLNCSDPLSGAIDLKVTGGEEPYAYLWSDGSASASLDSIGSGYYEVTVSDQKGCEKSRLFYVRPQPTLSVTSSVLQPTCEGSDGSISLSVSGGVTPYTFEWSSGEVTSSIANLNMGTYQVDIYDAGGCSASREFVLAAPDSCDSVVDTVDPSGCCDGKVAWLTLEYLGEEETTIQVVQRNDHKVVFDGFVSPGEEFTFWGEDRNGTLGPEIILKTGQSDIQIHTSCSEPIGPGLTVGEFRVIAGASRNGGELCPVPADAQQESYDDNQRVTYNLYPNPSHRGELKLRIDQTETSHLTVSIYDFTGRLRHEKEIKVEGSDTIQLGDLTNSLSRGQYFIKIEGEQSDIMERLIIK